MKQSTQQPGLSPISTAYLFGVICEGAILGPIGDGYITHLNYLEETRAHLRFLEDDVALHTRNRCSNDPLANNFEALCATTSQYRSRDRDRFVKSTAISRVQEELVTFSWKFSSADFRDGLLKLITRYNISGIFSFQKRPTCRIPDLAADSLLLAPSFNQVNEWFVKDDLYLNDV